MKYLALMTTLFALLPACAQAGSDPYGLLFTTPEQRARLDNRFNTNNISKGSSSSTGNTEQQVVRPLKLNGTLISSSGKKEVWINGKSQLAAGDKNDNRVRLLNADKVRIKPSASGEAHDMKPGQVLDPKTGTVSEAYQQVSTPQPAAGNSQ